MHNALTCLYWLFPCLAPLSIDGGSGGGGGDGSGGAGGDAGGSGGSGGGDGGILTGGAGGPSSGSPGAAGGAGAGSSGSGAADAGAIVGEGGTLNHDALFRAHPELKAHEATLRNYKTVEAALKGLGDTKSLVGRKLEAVETVLNPAADDVVGQGLRRQYLDIPDTPDLAAYEFKAPEGVELDAKRLENFAAKAHELGVNRKQFQALVEYQAALAAEDGQSLEEAIFDADAKAKADFWAQAEKEFGGKDAKDKALDLTVRMLRSTGLSDEEIGEIGKGLHHSGAKLIVALAKLATNVGEDKLPHSGGQGGTSVSAKEAYRAIIHNKDNPDYAAYHNPAHADHAAVRAKVQALIKKASGKG